MVTSLRFLRGFILPYSSGTQGASEFLKFFYEFWGYCVNGTSALQYPGGMANTMSTSYSISNTTGAGVSPIVVTTTSTNALVTGMQVSIVGVGGCTASNGMYQITVTSTTTFSLNGTTGNGAYTGGGTVNTTPFAFPLNFTEGTNVFTTGSDGYTSAQISVNASGDATFQALTNNPFNATATSLSVNQATNYQTTIAAGSNGVSLPTGTINIASTTTASTTITASSNGVSLPTATINVVSTTGFPSGGYIKVVTTAGTRTVTYTGITATTFTGCTGGIGSMTTGGGVTVEFPASGPLNVITTSSTTVAAGSNGQSLPQTTINVASTTNFPSAGGTIGIATSGSTTIAAASNGVILPQSIINVASTAGFPTFGSIMVTTSAGSQLVSYIGTTATTFTGCSGGLGTMSTGGAVNPTVTYTGVTASTFTGCTGGIGSMTTGNSISGQFVQSVTYTGSTGTSFTGCTGGVGTMNTGRPVYAPIQLTTTVPNTYPNLGSNVVTGTLGNTSANGTWILTTPSYSVNNALYFGTTVAFPSNTASLPQATINSSTAAPFTTTTGVQTLPTATINVAATAPASTTVAAGSTGVTLPTATVNVASTTGFPTSGSINVSTEVVTTVALGSNGLSLPQSTIFAAATAGFTATGTINVSTTTATTTTGVQTLPTGTINVAATATASTTIAAGSNGASLPQATINVASTTGFPTIGTINVTTGAGIQTVTYTGVTGTTFTGCSGGTGTMSTGGAVDNTGFFINFPASGNIAIVTTAGAQLVAYTGITATSFTGCTGGAGNTSAGGAVNLTQAVTYTGVTGTTFTGCSGGTGVISTNGSILGGLFPQVVNYTGVTATSFTGCTGGFGEMITGNAVNNTGLFNTLPTAGSIYIVTTTGPQLVTYTGVNATQLTGASGGSGNTSSGGSVFTAFSPASAYTPIAAGSNGAALPQTTINVTATSVATTTIDVTSNGQALPASTINVASTTGFPANGTIYVTTNGGQQVVTYTGKTPTSFTGCTNGSGNMSTGGAVSAGFPNSGYIYVTTNLGYQVVTYTGITGTTFTGCTGGSGTMSTGGTVFLGYPPTGVFFVTSTTGTYPITYTGTTATTFTGASGGNGIITTGGTINSSISVVISTAHTLLTGHTIIASGIVGLLNINSTFTVSRISDTVLSLNSALGLGAYISGGLITDHSNFYLNGSVPNGNWTSAGTATTTSMVNKCLVIWKPNSGTSEDSIYLITSVSSSNTIKINLNTGGTPDPITFHPSFTQRSNINYRVVDFGPAGNAAGQISGNYLVFQMNPSAIGINPGQANSQAQISRNASSELSTVLSPGGNWNGVTFPSTGNYQIDASSTIANQGQNYYNGTANGNVAMTMAADPAFFWAHMKDINSANDSSYYHLEIPTRLYPQAADTNPIINMNRGGNFAGTVFTISNNPANFGRGFVMKGTDNTARQHYSLAKSLSGDGSPVFGITLTDFRLAFNTAKGFILASDVILSLPASTGQFSLGRAKLRTMKFTSTPLPVYHRFGTPGGTQYLNTLNGCAIIWDNTILPTDLFYII